jgi:tetratricopeptide (TPR) repeat protein
MHRQLATGKEAFRSLARYGLTSAESVLAHFVASGDTIRAAVQSSPLNTLDRPRYEFYSPWDYAPSRIVRLARNLDLLIGLRRSEGPTFLSRMRPEAEHRGRLRGSLEAAAAFLDGNRRSLSGAPLDETFRRFDSALALAPWDDGLRASIALHYYEVSGIYVSAGDLRTAARLVQRAVATHEDNAVFHLHYSFALVRFGQLDRALEEATTAVRLDPRLPAARRALADYLLQSGRREEAREQLQALLALIPGDAAATALLNRR